MKLGRLWSWFWSFAGGVSTRIKIMGIVLMLILLLGLGITVQVRNSLITTLSKELERQGVTIAQSLATQSADLILTGNSFDLYQLLVETVKNNEDMRYAFILSRDKRVISHSFSSGFPVGLAEANMVEPGTTFQLEMLDTNEDVIWDIAVPILGGRLGIARVGMSFDYWNREVVATTWRLLLYTGIVSLIGLLGAYVLTLVLTRPIVHLVEVTMAIARGDLKRKAQVWAADEIGRLGMAFNSMTESLARSRRESDMFQKELLKRNRELVALNAVAAEVSGPKGLTQVMSGSLAKVLEALGLNAGWVSILTEDRRQLNLVCHEGLSPEIIQKIAVVDLHDCACRSAVSKKSPVVIGDGSATCLILGHKLYSGESVLCHIAVPLISKSRVFGLLHVASAESNQFTGEDIELLNSIGHQMGVAIENARLWEELKRKEEVRGQLLEQLISAQEAERKRIARELHDQTGQSLTSLIMGLRVLEARSPPKVQKSIADLKRLTTQTLDEVHNLALELRPSSLDDLGLITALRQYVTEYSSKFGIEADFQAIGMAVKRLPVSTEIALYRIIQEALTNIVKHAAAKKVGILMEVRGDSIVTIVEDDGKGFDVQKVLGSRKSERKLGLYGMQERTSLIGGVLTIESRPGAGTTIFVEVPLKEEWAK